MKFGDGEKEISDYWQKYYEELGVPVPLGRPGTNPGQLAKSEKLHYIIYKAFDQKTYSDQRITKDLVVITYDSKFGEIARVEFDNALKEINILGSGKSDDSYIKSVPEKVEQMASEILPEYGYSLPAMELQIVLCGTV